MLTVLSRPYWLFINIILLVIVSCTSQQVVEPSPVETPDPGENSQAATSTIQPEQPTTKPAAVEIEITATAVPSVTPTIVLEPTIEQESVLEPTIETERSNANADVLFVKARQESEDTWHFTVTVEHPDTGWEDYADGWDVVLPDGSVSKPDQDSPFTRLILHPHETEQPFTRSQGRIMIAPGTAEVTVRAHDLVDGFGGREVILDLTSGSGPDFEIQRLP